MAPCPSDIDWNYVNTWDILKTTKLVILNIALLAILIIIITPIAVIQIV